MERNANFFCQHFKNARNPAKIWEIPPIPPIIPPMGNKRKAAENWEIPPIPPISPIKINYMNVNKIIYIKNFIFLGGNGANREKNKEIRAFASVIYRGKNKNYRGKNQKHKKTNRTNTKKQSENNNKNFFYFFA